MDPLTMVGALTSGTGLLTSLFGRPNHPRLNYQPSPEMLDAWKFIKNLPTQQETYSGMNKASSAKVGLQKFQGSRAINESNALPGQKTKALSDLYTKTAIASGGQAGENYAKSLQPQFNIAQLMTNWAAQNQGNQMEVNRINALMKMYEGMFPQQIGAGLMGLGGPILAQGLKQ